MRTLLRITLALALLTVAARSAMAASIVLNGGFETGTLAGWTATPSSSTSLFGVNSDSSNYGAYSAFFGGVNTGGGDEDTISQSFATIPGQSYVVDFWLAFEMTSFPPCDPFSTCIENDFSAFWNGAPLLSILSASEFPFTKYTFLLSATGGTSTISFAGAALGFREYRLDDVSVSEVPEPASLTLLVTGLAVWLGGRYRRSRRNRVSG
jgi:hypothetical protein